MGDRCIGVGCTLRFKDRGKSKGYSVKNVTAPKYNWLLELLNSDGVNTAELAFVPRICYKCFKKYDRRRAGDYTSATVENNGDVDDIGHKISSVGSSPRNYSKVSVMEVANTIDNNDANGNGDDVKDDHNDDDDAHDDDGGDDDDQGLKAKSRISNQLPLLTVNDLYYGAASHRKCSICLQYSDSGLVVLPKLAKRQLMFHHNLWCPNESRVCSEHLIGNDLHPDVAVDLSNRSLLKEHLSDRADQVINDLLDVAHYISECDTLPRLEFTRLSDEDCKAWTGWTTGQLMDIHAHCFSHLPTASTVSTENALILFWTKLKTNISWQQLSTLCGVSASTVSRTFHNVLSALNETVVPQFLGTHHMSREEAVTHNTTFTKSFYGDKVTLILDGTYIYIPKSTDHKLQRASYSGQKKRNLVKFMSIVFPDGYVLDTVGPFFGNENDAKITEKILLKVADLKSWLEEADNFIVDKGFRDVLELLKTSGYESYMPSYMKPGQSQHDTAAANVDRMCTKTRWVVESYHGRLKHWRMFKDQLTSNYFIPVLGDLVRVVTACLNGIRGPIYKPNPERDARDKVLAERMQARLRLENTLAQSVEAEPNMSRRCKAEWKKLEASNIDFPKLDLEYLETVACGSYQLGQAPGYIEEHLTDDGDYEIWIYQHSDDLIRGQIKSRHKSQTKYNVWIRYDLEDKNDPVKDYYCVCPAGKRTIGMCAHTASILYFLGYLAYQSTIQPLPQAKRFKSSIVS